MERRDHWQNVYETKAESSVSWFQETPETSLRLIGQHAAPGASVIDIGGGASRLVDHLLDRGYGVAVLDIAEAALDKSRHRLGDRQARVEWIAADITLWKPAKAFDVWHDRAVFHFLTEAVDRQAYAQAMAAGVKPGGMAVIGTFALNGPERCSGLPVCRYDAAGLAAQFAEHFRLIGKLAETHRTPGGSAQNFQFAILARLD